MVKRGRIVAFFIAVILIAATIGTTVTGVTKDINLGLDLEGGFEILYDVETVDEDQEVNQQVLESTVESLYERVDVLGISETNISIESGDRIRVQLAGVQDQQEARELLSTTAQLSFRDVEGNEYMDGSDIKEGSAQQTYDQNNSPIVSLEVKSASEFYDVTQEIANKEPIEDAVYPPNLLVIWLDYDEEVSFEDEYGSEDPAYVSAPR